MSEPTRVTVKTCGDCPMIEWEYFACQHPAIKAKPGSWPQEVESCEPPPSWCPLRTAPVLVALETK